MRVKGTIWIIVIAAAALAYTIWTIAQVPYWHSYVNAPPKYVHDLGLGSFLFCAWAIFIWAFIFLIAEVHRRYFPSKNDE